jgi:ABC-type transport system involved in multi-copper enzyme maturation permease subunit
MSQQTYLRVVRAEWLKFRTLATNIRATIITIALTVGFGALVTSAVRSRHGQGFHKVVNPTQTALVGVFFAQFAIGVMGSKFFTDEYSSSAIRTTLTAVPHRLKLLASKFTVVGLFSLVVGEVATAGAFMVGQMIYRGSDIMPASWSNPGVARAVFLTGIYLTLMALWGSAFGLIFRAQAITITVFVSILMVLPLIASLLPSNWTDHINKFMPINLGQAMRDISQTPGLFGPWSAGLCLLAYVVITAAIGASLFVRRDA